MNIGPHECCAPGPTAVNPAMIYCYTFTGSGALLSSVRWWKNLLDKFFILKLHVYRKRLKQLILSRGKGQLVVLVETHYKYKSLFKEKLTPSATPTWQLLDMPGKEQTAVLFYYHCMT